MTYYRYNNYFLRIDTTYVSDNMMQSGRITPVRAPPLTFPKANQKFKQEKETRCCDQPYPTSFCNQLFVLLKRNFLIILRDRTLTYSRLITHICIGLFIGILYYDIGKDASNILNNFNYLFFSVIFLQFTAFNSVTTTCKYYIFGTIAKINLKYIHSSIRITNTYKGTF